MNSTVESFDPVTLSAKADPPELVTFIHWSDKLATSVALTASPVVFMVPPSPLAAPPLPTGIVLPVTLASRMPLAAPFTEMLLKFILLVVSMATPSRSRPMPVVVAMVLFVPATLDRAAGGHEALAAARLDVHVRTVEGDRRAGVARQGHGVVGRCMESSALR